jgi:long-chain acyl-CoA synthetase
VSIVQLIRERAVSQPEQPAYIPYGSGESLSYRALVEAADQVADWLRSSGCQPGQRCGLLMPEGAGFLIHALGVLTADLCLVPVNPNWSENEQEFVIDKAGLHWLIPGDPGPVRFPFARTLDRDFDREIARLFPAYIRFTSGTTGERKGVLLGHETILQRMNAANEIFRITAQDVVWFQLPMVDHFVASTLLYLSRGATMVTNQGSELETSDPLIRDHQPTISYASPDFYEALLASSSLDLGCLRLAVSTTKPLSPRTQRGFIDRFGKALNPALGIIEVGILTINLDPKKADAVGRPLPAYRVTLLGEDGQPAAQDQSGELSVQGPGLLDAYVAPWQPRAEILSPFGYRTGDYARQDAEGFIYLLGRSANRIAREGVSLFYEQVEEVLNQAPGVIETRVSTEKGILVAEVVGSPSAIERLPDFVRDRLDSRVVPNQFRQVETLPRTANGKLLRR